MPTKFLVRALVLAAVLFVNFTSTFAQEPPTVAVKQAMTPEKRALIARLLDVTESRKAAVEIFKAMLDQQDTQLSDPSWDVSGGQKEIHGLSKFEKDELRKKSRENSARMSKRMRELFTERIDFAQLVEDIFYDLYDKYFTEAEIKDLVTFYSSPTGKKSVELQPKMFAESMSSAAVLMKPKVLEIMTEFSKEEEARIQKEYDTETAKQPVKPKPKRPTRKRT